MEGIMKTVLVLTAISLMAVNSSQLLFCQPVSTGTMYVIRIKSMDSNNAQIHFSAAYAYAESSKSPMMTSIEKETPFELRFSASKFLGMFQNNSHDGPMYTSL